MAFLLGPLLTEISALTAGVLAEIGVSTEVAVVGGGLVSGQVGAQANKIVSDAIPTDVKEKASDLFELVNALNSPYDTKNINYLINRKRMEQEQKRLMGTKPVIGDEKFDQISSGKVIKSIKSVVEPKHISELITGHSSALADSGHATHLEDLHPSFKAISDGAKMPNDAHMEIVNKIVGTDPAKLTTLQKVSNFMADKAKPNNKEFNDIYEIYNGSGLEPRNVVMSQSIDKWLFFIYDETGKRLRLEQDKNAFTIPNVYGNFGGLRSSNSNLPIDVPDTCFLCHDIDYSQSMFNTEADYKLVSRLLQRRSSWPQDSVKLLNSIVIYFATVGSSLSALKGSIVGNPAKEIVVDDVKDDIFPVVSPNAVEIRQENPSVYATLRKEFYEELEKETERRHMTYFSEKVKEEIDYEIF